MRMIVPGTVVGLVLAFTLSQALSGLLFQIGPHDTATFFGATMLLVTLTVLASLIPAFAAMRVDPVTTLRIE